MKVINSLNYRLQTISGCPWKHFAHGIFKTFGKNWVWITFFFHYIEIYILKNHKTPEYQLQG